jgi:hypothetical protein
MRPIARVPFYRIGFFALVVVWALRFGLPEFVGTIFREQPYPKATLLFGVIALSGLFSFRRGEKLGMLLAITAVLSFVPFLYALNALR